MPERLTLTELQLIIRDSLYFALPDSYWIIAEISELKENNIGHCYLELIEKNPEEKNVRARIRAIIWNNRYRFLKAYFENTTRESFRVGIKMLVKVRIEYHELYGLSLIISDIDPAFTLGDMAVKRQNIIDRLEKEGIFSMNKELPFPGFPQRIAIVSSKSAAGYIDFINHLKGNNYGYSFHTTLFDAVLQGPETEHSVINALNIIASDFQRFDVAVIIRGGGSQTDLSWFDNYNIAYHITQFPLPVITGIGHDKDISVTDLVANISLRTPTAVANFLIDSMAESEKHITDMCSSIIAGSRIIITQNRNHIESSAIRLFPLARLMMANLRDRLSSSVTEIMNIGKSLIIRVGNIPSNQKSRLNSAVRTFSAEKSEKVKGQCRDLRKITLNAITNASIKLKSMDSTLELLNPEKILERGYSITCLNGKIIKRAEELNNNDIVDTKLHKGSIRSSVIKSE